MMEALWSMSTTIREGDRIVGFLKTALKMDGEIWDKNAQMRFQILLIQDRQYLNDPDNSQNFNNLNEEQSEWLRDKTTEMTYEQAVEIFRAKRYEDPPMRGRQSMSPLQKLGLVYILETGKQKHVYVTEVGKKLAAGEIDFCDFMTDSLLKFQYPNPFERGFSDWNTKPFINTLRLIKKVNFLCAARGIKAKGISNVEFGIFALSLKSYRDVDEVAQNVLEFRERILSYTDNEDREVFTKNFIKRYLCAFNNPVKNVFEYADNMVRYLRLTRYIYIRGKYSQTYIDLEPRRMTEIDAILENDDGSAQTYTKNAWLSYMGTYKAYALPFETREKLTKILTDINLEIQVLEEQFEIRSMECEIPTTKTEMLKTIAVRRKYRTSLQNLELRSQYHNDTEKIDEAIQALKDIASKKRCDGMKSFPVALEKWTNVALNIIDDAVEIKPMCAVGDDNEPIFTAPGGVADIECYYGSFGAIAEVTMLTSRDQWYNEGQPVMRHLRDFEKKNASKPNYCLFVAPRLHVDTINQFYTSVKYEYEGARQKIIPLTIGQLINILEIVKMRVAAKNRFSHHTLMAFYNGCTDFSNLSSSVGWQALIDSKIFELSQAP